MLTSLVSAVVAIILLGLAAWSRRGRSRSARWWVRRVPIASAHPLTTRSETVGLVVLPYLGQLALVLAVGALPGFPPSLIPVAVIGEVVLLLVLLVPTAYRRVLPLALYPRWLRGERAADRATLTAMRRGR